MKFHTTVVLGGKTATGLEVPAEVVDALASGRRPSVVVTINDFSYRSTVAVMGGVSMIPLSAENRSGAGVVAGDEVDVDLALDTAPRVVDVSPDLAAALDAVPAARAAFDALSYSGKRQQTLAVDGAKTDATRQRRIEKVITTLTPTA